MRTLLAVLIAISVGVFEASAQVLDARVPNGSSTRSNAETGGKGRPLSVTITDLPDQNYFTGDLFDYEVEVKNDDVAPLKIPWTVDAVWNETTSEHRLMSSVALTLTNAAGVQQTVGATLIYGVEENAATIHELQPGATARIRLAGRWSLNGVNPSEYLGGSQGRVTAQAVYRLIQNGVMSSTKPSAPKELTLTVK